MSILGQKGSIDAECSDFSFLKVKTKDPEPSAVPSETPSLSLVPTAGPTISFAPSISMNPSLLPSTSPTKVPTSSPTKSPTGEPSVSPSRLPSRAPSPLPTTSRPPSLSPSKSSHPTDEPTLSAYPSPSPSLSQEPSLSTRPSTSTRPTADRFPSFAPTSDPSGSPSQDPTRDGSPTSNPSPPPTGTPTLCEDDLDWKFPDSAYPNLSCESIKTDNACNIFSKPPYIANGKSAKDACCMCGGSIYLELPSSHPSQCNDVPNWKDSNGLKCDDYMDTQLCSTQNVTGTNDLFASDACCCCGGGQHKSFSPSSSPTRIPSLFPSDTPTMNPTIDPSMMPTNIPTVTPSKRPSSSPTQCKDDSNWITQIQRKGATCYDVNLVTALCNTITERVNGKSVRDACCACGGSAYATGSPTSRPQCFDVPNWKDEQGFRCNKYITYAMCNSNVPGEGGIFGKDACCNCKELFY